MDADLVGHDLCLRGRWRWTHGRRISGYVNIFPMTSDADTLQIKYTDMVSLQVLSMLLL